MNASMLEVSMTATFGQQLRVKRKAAGMSLDDLADASGLSKTYINNIELNNMPEIGAGGGETEESTAAGRNLLPETHSGCRRHDRLLGERDGRRTLAGRALRPLPTDSSPQSNPLH